MKIQIIALIVSVLLASQIQAEVKTESFENPIYPGREVTLAAIDKPTVGQGSTPDGVSADQTFTYNPEKADLPPVKAGVNDGEPVLEPVLSGRKMLAGRKMLDSLLLNGDGVSAGADGAGVSTAQNGHGTSGLLDGNLPGTQQGAHIQPHVDDTTVTAAGQSVNNCFGVNPDNLGGEGKPTVFANSGCK